MKKQFTVSQVGKCKPVVREYQNKQQYGTKEYPSFWKTIVESKEGILWYKEMMKRFSKMVDAPIGKATKDCFDIDESYEAGWMSPAHWKSFVKFIKTLK
jgi:hypothetical protein